MKNTTQQSSKWKCIEWKILFRFNGLNVLTIKVTHLTTSVGFEHQKVCIS